MKFTSSVIGKIFLVLICIILGIVIALGGLVGGVYFVLTKATVGQIEEKITEKTDDIPLNFDEEVKDKTVLAWVKELVTAVSDMNVTTVGQLEGLVGMPVISDALYNMVGVEAAAIKESTFGDLGATVAKSLTVEKVSEKFEVGLPDMPIFNDPEFLATPISEAFEGLTDKKLNEFVEISETESNAVLKAIQDLKISEIGGEKLTEKINGLKLSEVIEIDEEESNSVLVALKDTTIGELGGTEADGIIKSMFVGEIMEINAESEKILQTLKYASVESVTVELDKTAYDAFDAAFRASAEYTAAAALEVAGYEYIYGEDGTPYVFVIKDEEKVYDPVKDVYLCYKTKLAGSGAEQKNHPLIGFNDRIGTITFGDVVDIDASDPSTTPLMSSLKGTPIVKMDETVDRLFLDEMIQIDDDSAQVLKSIKYTVLSDKTAAIKKADADAVVPAPEDVAKQLDGYIYKYETDAKGNNIPYVCVTDGGVPKTVIVNGEEYYEVYETKYYDGYYRPIKGLGGELNELKLSDVFTETELSTGVLSLIGADTKLNDIGGEVTAEIQGSSLAVLAGVGVINASGSEYDMTNTPKEQKAFIWNNNLNGMLGSIIKFVDEPIKYEHGVPAGANYDLISEPSVDFAGATYSSLTAFVKAYQGADYATYSAQKFVTINLTGNVTVNVDTGLDAEFLGEDGKYYIPVFNLDGSSYRLTVTGGDVALASMGNGAREKKEHQYYYAFDASNGGSGSGLKYYDGTDVLKDATATGSGYCEYRKVA